jgi:hypothetical protein
MKVLNEDTKKMKSREIESILMHHLFFKQHCPIAKHFTGAGLGECDVISITKNRVVYEYEIKVSRSDFKADFKKSFKHRLLRGDKTLEEDYRRRWEVYLNHRPNHFYYVVPEGLVKVEEIPSYAGLIYIKYDNSFSGYDVAIIKNAPKIHKVKATQELYDSLLRNLTAKTIFNGKATIDRAFIKSTRSESLIKSKDVKVLQQDIIDLLKRIQEIATDTMWMDELGCETIAERLIKMYGDLGGDENKIKFMYDSNFFI